MSSRVFASGAAGDPSGRYRYTLWRRWDPMGPRVAMVMLNPSTADAVRDDPTISRCVRLARGWGYGSLEVVNLFALRAQDPRVLHRATDPVGPENDRYLIRAIRRATTIVAAWGNHGSLGHRDRQVMDLLAARGSVYCLGKNLTGQPRHPLYLRGDTPLVRYRWRSRNRPQPAHSAGVSVRRARAWMPDFISEPRSR